MKKIIVSIALLATMAASANAGTLKSHVTVSANQTMIAAQSGNGWDIGYGVSKVWDNSLYAGFDMNYGQVKMETQTANNFGMDLKLGYKWKDIAVYGIGSGIGQSFQDLTGYGFGYGAGVEYAPSQYKHIAIGVDYKTYSITNEVSNYDYDTAKVYVKVIF